MSRSDYWSKIALLLLSGGCLYAPVLAGQIASSQTHLSAEQLKQVDQLVTEGIDKEKSRDHKGAMELFNQALMLDRHSYRAYVNRAWSRKETADYEGAISDYSSAIRLKPNSCWVYVNRGWCYQKLNNQDKALADFNRAIRINPKYVYAYKHRGALLLKKGDYRGSLNDYNTVIALNPSGDKDLQTYLQPDFFSGGFEENQMKPTPANPPVKRSKPAAAESPDPSGLASTELEDADIAKLNNRAAVAIKAGRFKDAITILEKLAHQNPDYDLARDNLSIAYNNQGLSSARKDPEESISKFRSSLFYAPSETTARQNLEQMLRETGKDPRDFKVRMALGDEARDKGDITSAFVEYSEALRLENTAELRSRLADICMKLDAGIKVAAPSTAGSARAKAASIFDATTFDAANNSEFFAKPSPDTGAKVAPNADAMAAKPATTPVVAKPVTTPVIVKPAASQVIAKPAVTQVVAKPAATPVVSTPAASTPISVKVPVVAATAKAGTTPAPAAGATPAPATATTPAVPYTGAPADAAIASAKTAMKQSSFSVTLGPKSSTPMTIDSQQLVAQLTKLAQNPQIVSEVSKLAQNPQVISQVSKISQNIQSQAKNGILTAPPKTGEAAASKAPQPEQVAVAQAAAPQAVQVPVPQAKAPQAVQVPVPQAAAPQAVQVQVPQSTGSQAVQVQVPQATAVKASAPQLTPPQTIKTLTEQPPAGAPQKPVAPVGASESSPQATPQVANSEPDRVTFRSAFTRMKRGLMIKGAPQPETQTAVPPQVAASAAAVAQPAAHPKASTPSQVTAQSQPQAQSPANVPAQAAAAQTTPAQATPAQAIPAEAQPPAAVPEAVAAQPAPPSTPVLAPASDLNMTQTPPSKPPEAALMLGTHLAPVDPAPADSAPRSEPQQSVPPQSTNPQSTPPQAVAALAESGAPPTPEAPTPPESPAELRKAWQQRIADGDRLYKENNYAESERNFKESAAIAQSLGDSAELVISLDKLAGVLLIQNRNHDAMTSLTQALDVRKRLLPPGHPNIGETENRLNFVRSRVAAH